MKVLHVTPHLGGGVGKGHAAISAVLPNSIEQTFVLLEAPRERRYADLIAATGARLIVAANLADVKQLAADADIVQFEFWNHPKLFECLARCDFAPMRGVFWSHISGLFRPVIQPALIEAASRFVFTTPASIAAPGVAALLTAHPRKIATINSGFGFPEATARLPAGAAPPKIAYLGTVDFTKMHPGFFDVIDALQGDDIRVSVWGAVDPEGEVAQRARAMRHPERVVLRGQTDDPRAALSEADIFFYPLRPDHYGTAENVLVEAMSLGLTAIVLGNPAEAAIIRDGVTGLMGRDIAECGALLRTMLDSPDRRARIGRNAMQDVVATRTPEISAEEFVKLWQGLLDEPAREACFRDAIGDTPADWYLSTQRLPGTPWQPAPADCRLIASKGSLAHFESVAKDDVSLADLRRTARGCQG